MFRAVLVTAITAAALVGLYAAVVPRADGAPPENETLAGLSVEELRKPPEPSVAASSQALVTEPLVRDVTPAGMTAGPVVTGALKRIAPPAPEPEQEPPPAARRERLFNPIVTATGTIKARGREVRLAGIAAPEFEARCGDGAQAWPCGRMARAALRRFVRGRAIECQVPANEKAIPDPADCYVAGESLAAWLVIQGWAKSDGERFDKLSGKAREARLGIWSERRPGVQPAELAESSPARALPISDRVSGTP